MVNPEDVWVEDSLETGARMAVAEDRPFGGFVPTEFPSLEGPPIECVIITDSLDVAGTPVGDLVTEFQALADWKTATGSPTVVKTVRWIEANYPGTDRAERIRNFVKDASSNWGTRFVCLGGDIDIVPVRILSSPTERGSAVRSDPPVDWYYGELDSRWNNDGDAYWLENLLSVEFPANEYLDIWVGRLPCRNAAEAESMVQKLLRYRLAPDSGSPPSSSYYDDMLVVAGPTNGINPNSPGSCGVGAAEFLADSVSVFSADVDISRLYSVPPDLTPNCNGTPLRCYDALYNFLDPISYDPFTYVNFREELNSGRHFVYHVEHSNRKVLGDVSFVVDNGCPQQVWKDACEQAFRAANPGAAGDLTREIVDDLTNGPAYSIVMTDGSYVNQWDMDAVGEHFLRNPNGGAVAFYAKTASFSPASLGVPARDLLRQLLREDVAPIGEAAGLGINGMSSIGLRGLVFITVALLGDPEMPVWSEAPDTLSLTQLSGDITSLGTQEIVIRVEHGATAIDGARVCLKQGDDAYAVAWTNSDGDAIFSSLNILSTDDVDVVAWKRNFVPKVDVLDFGTVASPHHVVYDHHIRNDAPAGDGDDILEPGETQDLRVVARDTGNGFDPIGDVWAYLWPTAPIICDLRIEGEYDPDRIFLGAGNAHPTEAGQDTFRIPANWEAIRLEGEPDGSLDIGGMFVDMWRDTTALYHVKTQIYPTTTDSLVTGILLTKGGFSEVSWNAETSGGPDSVYFSQDTPDSIWFEFVRDGTDDELLFRAESADWMTVLTDSISLILVSADTSSGVFDVEFTGALPDREELVFTLAARNEDWTWWFSDFSESAHAPEVRQISQKTTPGFVNTTLFIRPTVANLGSAEADSVVLTLTKTAGSVTIVDDEVTIGAVAPGDTVQASNQFQVTAASAPLLSTLRYDLDVRTIYANGDSSLWSREDLDIQKPDAPTQLFTDEMGAAIVLRWDPADSADVEGYHVFQHDPGSSRRLTRDPVVGTSRFEITGLDDIDAGDYVQYRFSVSTVDSSGNESAFAYADTAQVWLAEEPGWPKYIRSGSAAAVKVYDLDGDGDLEILAAGKEIHAWHHDGTSVLPGTNGLFFDPGQADEDSINVFVQSLAVGDVDDNGLVDIVGNVRLDGLYAVEYNSGTGAVTQRWTHKSLNSRASPPILANLDQDGGNTLELLLMSDDSASPIHVWSEDGSPYNGVSSEFVKSRTAATFQYRTVAVADLIPDSAGLEIVQAVANPSTSPSDRDSVYCWNGISGDLMWVAALPGDRNRSSELSVPVIADVDSNDTLDVVVARGIERHDVTGAIIDVGGVFVLAWHAGSPITVDTLCTVESPYFEFTGEPVVMPTVANLDGDSDLEIVIPGGSYRLESSTSAFPGTDTLRTHVLDLSGGTLEAIVGEDHVPIPSRKYAKMVGVSGSVIADLDGDGTQDFLISMDNGFLGRFSWDGTGTALAEDGWPRLFPDEATTPTVVDLDRDGDLELIIQDLGGVVHVLATAADTSSVRSWWQFGADSGNTFAYAGPVTGGVPFAPSNGTDEIASREALTVGFTNADRNPLFGGGWIQFAVAEPVRVRLDVHDLQGRRVRELVNDDFAPGNQRVYWDGRDSEGRRSPRGIYFYRLQIGAFAQNRKVLLLR